MRIQEARQEEKDSKEKGEKEPIQVDLYQKNKAASKQEIIVMDHP